jgi:outer membrane immunogenic protein
MKHLKHLTAGLISALALGTAVPAANAADINRGGGSYKDTGPEYVPSITWTGFYIGAHAGASFEDNEEVDVIDDAVFLAGGHLGFNWQSQRNFVFGIEGDVSYVDEIDYLASIRARLGYSFGKTMAYATGGAAFIGAVEDDVTDDETQTGYVVGGGLEHKLRQNVSIGAETLYYSFEDENAGGEDLNFWVARARLTYHFNGQRDALK